MSTAKLHTENLYKFDEVISALQKSIRRCNIQQSTFWAGELYKGFAAPLYSRLWTILTEDIGLANPLLINRLLPIYRKWQINAKKNPQIAAELTLEFVHLIASSSKSRLVDHLSIATLFQPNPDNNWSYTLPNKELTIQIEQLTQVDLFASSTPNHLNLTTALLQFAYCIEQKDLANTAFFLNIIHHVPETNSFVQRLNRYLNITPERIERKITKHASIYCWFILFESCPSSDSILYCTLKNYYTLWVENRGHHKLWLNLAIALFCTPEAIEYTPEYTSKNCSKEASEYFNNTATTTLARRRLAIPYYAIDRHTERGRPSKFKPHNIADLHQAAADKKINSMLWSSNDIAKSHGNYTTAATDPKSQYSMRFFFNEGAQLENVPKWLNDPWAEKVKRYFLQLEHKYGEAAFRDQFILKKMIPIWLKNQVNWTE